MGDSKTYSRRGLASPDLGVRFTAKPAETRRAEINYKLWICSNIRPITSLLLRIRRSEYLRNLRGFSHA
jgi:hypothetical protein